MRRPFSLALIASASMLPLAAPALAQEDEEIVVTAQKREELLREVPQSVTAITSETFERIQANDLSDYVGRIPGMVALGDQPGDTRLTLRGVSTGTTEHVASVANYVDETPFGFSGGVGLSTFMTPDLDPADLARVEVLRGPQGTLYGANALGGLIKFVTVAPSPDGFEANFRASAETVEDGDNSYTARASVNVPLGEQAAIRVSGYRRDVGGFVDAPLIGPGGTDNVDSTEISGWRVGFLLNATENLTIRLSAVGRDIESDFPSTIAYSAGPGGNGPFEPIDGNTTDQDTPFLQTQSTTYRIYNGTIDWDLGWASLISATSYTQFDHSAVSPLAGPFVLLNNFPTDKVTQEIRLASPGTDQGLEWLIGYFYTNEDALYSQNLILGPPPGTPINIGDLFGIPNDGTGTVISIPSEYTEHAVFGTLTYHFSPQFDVAIGGRYSENEQALTQNVIGGAGAIPSAPRNESTENVTTWSFAPRWRPSDSTMVYGRIATGFRPGGPNAVIAPGFPPTFDSDTTTNYEIGVKTDFFDNMLRLDVAAFRTDWDDIQINVSVDLDGDGDIDTSANGNGGTATTQGIEWSAVLAPTDGLTIGWTGAYTNAELTSTSDFGADGAQLPNVPDWSSSVDVDYEWTAFGDATAYVGGAWRYIGERANGVGNAPIDLPSYQVVDLRTGVDFEQFGIQLFAKNVGDEDGPVSFGGTNPLAGSARIQRPRTIGVELNANF